MAPLRMFFLFLAFPCLIPGTAAAQLGFDPDPPEFVEDVPPPDDSVPSILDEIDLDDLLGDGPQLEPGDDVWVTPDGRAHVNPPLPEQSGGTKPAPEPRKNPDGSTTYPPGAPLPNNAGIPRFDPDGSVTVFPYGHGTIDPPPAGPGLQPGDDVITTPDGRAIVNPPLPPESGGTKPAPEPRKNPDGSTTYPPGVPLPFNTGIPRFNADGSVTIFPYGHGRLEPAPAGPGLQPGDDVITTPDGRAIVNPPLPPESGGGRPPRTVSEAGTKPRPSLQDLRIVRENLMRAEPGQPVYIPYGSHLGDRRAIDRPDAALLLRGIANRRARRRNGPHRRDREPRGHEESQASGRADPGQMMRTLRVPVTEGETEGY